MKRPRRPASGAVRKPIRKAGAKPRKPRAATRRGRSRGRAGRSLDASPAELQEIESLRADLERAARATAPARWNANPDDVRRSVIKLVLTLVELIRQLLERQAIRRMEADTLTPGETEAIGLALMRLEETIRELAAQFDLEPEDLNLDLGPVGKLM